MKKYIQFNQFYNGLNSNAKNGGDNYLLHRMIILCLGQIKKCDIGLFTLEPPDLLNARFLDKLILSISM